jgi:uncharacterized protein (TIGR02147 family)
MKTKPQEFRQLLQHELVERCRKNPQYSLRSFAKSLNVSPSALSSMLSGKRTITKKSKEKLGLALGLSLADVEKYKSADFGVSAESANSAILNNLKIQQLTLDSFALISDWYHYAILELMKVKDFTSDTTWVSKTLGISKSEANIAIERLLRLGLIELDKKGQWKDRSEGYSSNINQNLTSAGSKKLQKKILEQSITALEELPTSERNHTSMTFAMNPDLLPEAMQEIARFRRKFCTQLEQKAKPERVYQLSISLFPVSNTQRGQS